MDRFWTKVEKTPTCWLWTANISTCGYGQFSLKGRLHAAHRIAWALSGNVLAPGRVLDHLCRRKNCVNPDHLEAVTQRENLIRGNGPVATNIRKTKCVHGHAYTQENTVICKDGTRRCRTCKRGYDKRRYDALPRL